MPWLALPVRNVTVADADGSETFAFVVRSSVELRAARQRERPVALAPLDATAGAWWAAAYALNLSAAEVSGGGAIAVRTVAHVHAVTAFVKIESKKLAKYRKIRPS